MNPDARVKMHGVQVGKVASIDSLPDGTAALHLAMDPDAAAAHPGQRARRHHLVDGVRLEVRRTRAARRAVAAAAARRPGDQRAATSPSRSTPCSSNWFRCCPQIDPAKLNETLGAIAKALQRPRRQDRPDAGRLDRCWPHSTPACPTSTTTSRSSPTVFNAYADAAPRSAPTVNNATRISGPSSTSSKNLDALLVSAIGLADIGNRGRRRQPASR